MALKSGTYEAKVKKTVVVWPAPDANGDGEPIWEQRTDDLGRDLGTYRKTDVNGAELREYAPPEGFERRVNSAGESYYVKVDGNKNVIRQPNGEAINIRPGTALVLNPDGSVEVLTDEYAQYMFTNAHTASDGE